MANLIKMKLDTVLNRNRIINLMQNYTYDFEFELTTDGVPTTITGATPKIEMLKADGTYIVQTNDIVISGSKATGKINKFFTQIDGMARLQFILTKGADVFGSWVIKCNIKPSAVNGNEGESTNELTLIEELKFEVDKAQIVKEETEILILNGGAATKGEVNEVDNRLSSQLADIALDAMVPPPPLRGMVADFNKETKTGTDNTNILKAIISYAKNNDFKRIIIPRGNYLIKNKFEIDFDNIVIDGQFSTLYYDGVDSVQLSIIDNSVRSGECGYFTIRGSIEWTDSISQIVPKEIATLNPDSQATFIYSKIKLTSKQSDVKVGDYLRIDYELGTSSNHQNKYEPAIWTVAKVIDKDESWLYLDYYSPFAFNSGIPVLVNIVQKVNLRKNVKVENFNFVDLRSDTYKPVYGVPSTQDGTNRDKCLSGVAFTLTENCSAKSINGLYMKLPTVFSRYNRHCKIENITSELPMNLGGGAGYTVHCIGSIYQDVSNIFGNYTNPVVDFSGTTFSKARRIYGWKTNTVAFNFHGVCEHNNSIEDVYGGLKLSSNQSEFPGLTSDNVFKNVKGTLVGTPATYVFDTAFSDCRFDKFYGFNPFNVTMENTKLTMSDVYYPICNLGNLFVDTFKSSIKFRNCDIDNINNTDQHTFLNVDYILFDKCKINKNSTLQKYKINLSACKKVVIENSELDNVIFNNGSKNAKNLSSDYEINTKLIIRKSDIKLTDLTSLENFLGSSLNNGINTTEIELDNNKIITNCSNDIYLFNSQSKEIIILEDNEIINSGSGALILQSQGSNSLLEDKGNKFSNVKFIGNKSYNFNSKFENCNFDLSRKPISDTILPSSINYNNYVEISKANFNKTADNSTKTFAFEVTNIGNVNTKPMYFKGFLKYLPSFTGTPTYKFVVSDMLNITLDDIFLVEKSNDGTNIEVGIFIRNAQTSTDRFYVKSLYNNGFFFSDVSYTVLPTSSISVNPTAT